MLVNVKEQGVLQVNGGSPASGPLVIVNVTGVPGAGVTVPTTTRKVLAVTVWVLPTGLVSLWGVTLVQACNPLMMGTQASPDCWAEAGKT